MLLYFPAQAAAASTPFDTQSGGYRDPPRSPDAVLDVFAEMKRVAIRGDASKCNMDMRVLCVVVGCGHPFERNFEVLLHRATRSRVSRFRSILSPNSGETISFQRRSSPLSASLRAAQECRLILRSVEPNGLGILSCVALSRARSVRGLATVHGVNSRT